MFQKPSCVKFRRFLVQILSSSVIDDTHHRRHQQHFGTLEQNRPMHNFESMLGDEPKTEETGDSSSEFDDCEKEIYVRYISQDYSEEEILLDKQDDDDDTEEDTDLLLGSKEEDEKNSVGNDPNPRWSRFVWLVNKSWFPDSTLRICGAEMLEVEGVKLLKFFLTTIVGILFVHYYAQWTVS
jgi:hypothetical protein